MLLIHFCPSLFYVLILYICYLRVNIIYMNELYDILHHGCIRVCVAKLDTL